MPSTADEIINRFAAALARVASTYEFDRGLREDLLQDIIVAIVSALPQLRDEERLTAFVFRIAHNKCVNHVIKRQREPKLGDWLDELASETPSPEQQVIDREDEAALLLAVRALPLPYRQVITLVLEGLSHDEIASVLGISTVNVGVRVNRAKQQLKTRLGHA